MVNAAREVFADILEYPYMCAVDNSFSKYGGPTISIFTSEFARQIYYISDLPTVKTKLNVTDDLEAPMGVESVASVKIKTKKMM